VIACLDILNVLLYSFAALGAVAVIGLIVAIATHALEDG
jgi:hypothetical protein